MRRETSPGLPFVAKIEAAHPIANKVREYFSFLKTRALFGEAETQFVNLE